MSDFKIKVSAETTEAEKKLQNVNEVVEQTTKPRQVRLEFPGYQDLTKNFKTLTSDIKNTAESVTQFYKVAAKLPVGPVKDIEEFRQGVVKTAKSSRELGSEFGSASKVISNSLGSARGSVDAMLNSLAKVGVAMYALQSTTKAVSSAFSAFFSSTIGREAELRATILKTQTTLASTSRVFKGGQEITDPFNKIVSLTGAVRKNIDSIRERSIELAGVTSNEVIEVFGIVAGQIGQIGGGLKEAEDLAINFAAALGTFGLPIYQARQEIGSIFRGDITTDSYLAKALGITNQDIAKARTKAGGVVKFLEERLAAAVAGQKIAATGLSGVVSNIRDISELIGQNFGAGMLDPLIAGLTEVFDFLFGIRDRLFEISRLAGKTIGGVLAVGLGQISEKSKITPQRDALGNQGLAQAEAAVKRVRAMILNALDQISGQVASAIDQLGPALLVVTQGVARLAEGLISIKLERFKALVSLVDSLGPVITGLSYTVSAFFNLWAGFMELPLVQYLSQIRAGTQLLEASGIMPLVRTTTLFFVGLQGFKAVSSMVVVQFNRIRGVIGQIMLMIGRLISAIGAAGLAMVKAWQPASKSLQAVKEQLNDVSKALREVGGTTQQTGNVIGGLGLQLGGLGKKAANMVLNFIKFHAVMMLISTTVSVVTEFFGRLKEQQDKAANVARAEVALTRLRTVYANLGDSASEAEKRAAQFERQLVDAQYDQAVERLEKIRKKLEEIKDLSNGSANDAGDGFRRLFQAFNLENLDAWGYVLQNLGNLPKDKNGFVTFAAVVEQLRREQLQKAEEDLANWSDKVNEIAKQDQISIQAANLQDRSKQFAEARLELERTVADFRRGVENELFQARQRVSQKEIDIVQAAGQLRIFQMEEASKKELKNQEGLSREGLEALNNYLKVKEEGELDIEVQKKNIQIEVANLEKSISDYRIEQERRIVDIRKRILDYEKQVAQYRTQMASLEAQARTSGVATTTPGGGVDLGSAFVVGKIGSTGDSTGPHLDARWGDKRRITAADVAKYVDIQGMKITDSTVSSPYGIRIHPIHGDRRMHHGVDIPAASGTPIRLKGGARVVDAFWDPSGGGQTLEIATPEGNMRLLHLLQNSTDAALQAARNAAPSAATAAPSAANTGTSADFRARYLMRLSNLEGGYGKDGYKAYNPRTAARGYFQLTADTESDLRRRGRGRIADKMLAADFNTSAQGAYDFIVDRFPIAKYLFQTQDKLGLDRLLSRGTFSSLPGGGEAADAARLKVAEDIFKRGGIPGRANSSGSTSAAGAGTPAPIALPTIAPPAAPVFAGEDLSGVKRYTEAVRNLEKAMERLRALQQALTEAKTKAAFDNIIDVMFPGVPMEQYRDAIEASTQSLKAYGQIKDKVFDPEALQIEIDYQTELANKNREVKQLLEEAEKKEKQKKITSKELLELYKQIAAKQEEEKKQLEAQVKLKREALRLDRQATALKDLMLRNAGLGYDFRSELLRTQADFVRSTLGEDPLKIRLLEAEVKIREYRLELERRQIELTEEVLREEEEFAKQTRESAKALGTLEKAIQDYNKKLALAQDLGKTASGSLRSIFGDLLRGRDMTESSNEALTALSERFLNLFTDYIFAPLDKMWESIFKDFLGVPDPLVVAQMSNTETVKVNTTAIQELTEAIKEQTLLLRSKSGVNFDLNATTGDAATLESADLYQAVSPTAVVETTTLPASGPQQIETIPYTETGFQYTPETGTNWMLDTYSVPESAWNTYGTTLTEVSFSLEDVTTSADELSEQFKRAAEAAQPMEQEFSGFQLVMSGLAGLLGSISMGIAGVNQIKKGGTYNTLMGLAGIFKGISGIAGTFSPKGPFGGFFASGGTLQAGKYGIVGEEGPELVYAKNSLEVFSADQTKAMFSNTRTSLNQQKQSQARRTASATRGIPTPINVRYESQVINQVEYVTAEQHRKGMQEAARMGQALAYQGLQSSVQTRKRMGL